jgi:hypothetical protein
MKISRSNYQCAGLISRLYGDDLVCGVLFGSRAGVHEIMTSTGPQLIWTGDRWYSADDALKGHDYPLLTHAAARDSLASRRVR